MSADDVAVIGPRVRSRWERPALVALLVATALLYLLGLHEAGWGNEYYAAAAQAGTDNLTAWLFGSHDAGNAITVDKPPAALWLMSLSARVFGVSGWSILLPQALLGIGSVALLTVTVCRWSGPVPGLLAGAALAATPVAALMFRYDNPDALLTFLLILTACCTVRAIDAEATRWWSPSTAWLVAAAVALGFGFLTKMLQAMLVAPALAAVFLLAAAGGLASRLLRLATAGLTLLVAGGWFVVLVELWPERNRPYIGGSTDNSLWELALGYNGLGRILGGHGNPGGSDTPGPPRTPAFGGETGPTRLFRDLMGTEVSWLLPAALLGLAAVLWLSRRAPRTDRTRASALLWGGWLLVTGLVFSYMSGVVHPYYTVALAPATAAAAATSAHLLWTRRAEPFARWSLSAIILLTGLWSAVLLARTPEWLPWLRWTIPLTALVAACCLLVPPRLGLVLSSKPELAHTDSGPAATSRSGAAATSRSGAAASPRLSAAATSRLSAAATSRLSAAATSRSGAAATSRSGAAATSRPSVADSAPDVGAGSSDVDGAGSSSSSARSSTRSAGRPRSARAVTVLAAVTALVTAFAGTAAYAITTAAHTHSGGIPVSGPRGDAMAGPMGPPRGPMPGRPADFGGHPNRDPRAEAGADPLPGREDSAADADNRGDRPNSGTGGDNDLPGAGEPTEPLAGSAPMGQSPARTRQPQSAEPQLSEPGLGEQGQPSPGEPRQPGPPEAIPANPELEALLRDTDRRWAAATVGSFGASSLELRTGASVLAIGGFSGRDDAPTLDTFREYVAAGQIGYFLESRREGGPGRPMDGRPATADSITDWVTSHYTPRRLGEITVYDLSVPPTTP
ncbi:glycosyltransferase family 39 protein [Nocardia takedensis]|uniref:glycosyltransferase family 39 protein n=1 Tax=Nocardia takedensis TaxID=259390 RepID=UPI003F76561F